MANQLVKSTLVLKEPSCVPLRCTFDPWHRNSRKRRVVAGSPQIRVRVLEIYSGLDPVYVFREQVSANEDKRLKYGRPSFAII
jgi:hypothetical protein